MLNDLENWGFLKRNTIRKGRGFGSKTEFELCFENLQPQILDPQNTGFRTPDSSDLEPQNMGVSKEEPETKPERTGNGARDVFDFYNQTAKATGWTVHSKLTDAIRKSLNARLKEHGPDQVKRFITAMSMLEWTHKGFDGNRTFRASLIYICRPRTFAEHFDKLVTNQPEKPQLVVDGLSDLERCFQTFAHTGVWYGDRINQPHPHRPNDYPDELYERFGITRRTAA